MSRRALIRCILSLVLIVYLVVMVGATNRAERNDTFNDIRITVIDSLGTNFITAGEIDAALGGLTAQRDTLHRRNLNTLELTNRLCSMDRVEDARVLLMNNGLLSISVRPMVPVARVFDPDGSYYINATGKKVRALPEYHIDVPVITTELAADSSTVVSLLPMLNYIKADEGLNALVSTINIDRRGNIIIVPAILGHVIDFGDTSMVDNKFNRIKVFYRDVMPVKGWDAYDTISVKWSGRVTASRSGKNKKPIYREIDTEEIFDEGSADYEMLGDSVIPPIPPRY